VPGAGEHPDSRNEALPRRGKPRGFVNDLLPRRRQPVGSAKSALGESNQAVPDTGPPRGSKRVSLGPTEEGQMTVSMHRPMVKLDRPKSAPAFIIYAQYVVDRMTGNTWFPDPVPALDKVQGCIDVLHDAETDALDLTKGKKQVRNAALRRLVSHMDLLKAFVQFVADENPAEAVAIIESAGLSVKGRSYPVKEPFSARPWRVSGSVLLMVVAAAKVAGYHWQVSDDAGQTWKTLETTLQAKTVVPRLVPQKTYWFRYRTVVRRGPRDWSEPVSIVVR
jgi:hypothetical protein